MPRKKFNSTTAKNRTNKKNPKTGQFVSKDDDGYKKICEEILDICNKWVAGKLAEFAAKKYKSHRHVPDEVYNEIL